MAKINGKFREEAIIEPKERQVSQKRKALEVFDNEDDIRTRNSQVTLRDIPINLIKNREENKYILSNIEDLAESIEEIGLQQEIVVRLDRESNEESYIVVAGHRRITAYRYLRNKYLEKYGDEKHKTVLLYSYIRARVLTSSEELLEEKIYNHTNDKARDGLTPFEKLLRFDLDSINMDSEETRKDYLLELFGQEEYDKYLSGNSKVKFNQSAKYSYIHHLVKKEFKDDTTTLATIKAYVIMIQSSTPELIEAVLSGRIKLRDAKAIALYSKEDQIKIANGEATTEEREAISKKAKAEIAANEEADNFPFNYDAFIRTVKKYEKGIDELNKKVKELNKKEMNGNQKEFIKYFNKIVKDFDTLKSLETK